MIPKGQKQKQKRIRNGALLEALRDLGGGTVKSLNEDFLGQIPKDVFTQTGLHPQKLEGTPNPQEPVDLLKIKELEQRFRRLEISKREERLVFSSQQQEVKVRLAALQEEAKKMASATQNLAQEVKIAVLQTPVEPGTYHLTFLEKLISFIKSLTQKIENAAVWVSAFNQRAKKRPFYWAQVGRSGTKFMLSQERYMATQVG